MRGHADPQEIESIDERRWESLRPAHYQTESALEALMGGDASPRRA
jgi:hypothetical protein